MGWDGLKDRIEATNRRIRDIQGRIKRCGSLPQTEAVAFQKANYLAKLEAEKTHLRQLKEQLTRRDTKK